MHFNHRTEKFDIQKPHPNPKVEMNANYTHQQLQTRSWFFAVPIFSTFQNSSSQASFLLLIYNSILITRKASVCLRNSQSFRQTEEKKKKRNNESIERKSNMKMNEKERKIFMWCIYFVDEVNSINQHQPVE